MIFKQMDNKDIVLYVIQVVTFVLLVFSEYLGLTPKYKSNAILQMLICAMGSRDPPPPPPSPLLVVTPPTPSDPAII